MSVFIESSISAKQIARVMISFAWVYHGLFPKLVHIAPLEKLMTDSAGLSEQLSYLVTKTAGVCEILFGIVFFYLYQQRLVVWLNIAALIGLLLFVAILQPMVLIEAFNPVTTNLTLLGFSVILLQRAKSAV